jgi:hypothetical protein
MLLHPSNSYSMNSNGMLAPASSQGEVTTNFNPLHPSLMSSDPASNLSKVSPWRASFTESPTHSVGSTTNQFAYMTLPGDLSTAMLTTNSPNERPTDLHYGDRRFPSVLTQSPSFAQNNTSIHSCEMDPLVDALALDYLETSCGTPGPDHSHHLHQLGRPRKSMKLNSGHLHLNSGIHFHDDACSGQLCPTATQSLGQFDSTGLYTSNTLITQTWPLNATSPTKLNSNAFSSPNLNQSSGTNCMLCFLFSIFFLKWFVMRVTGFVASRTNLGICS